MIRLVLATRNPHKAEEIQRILGGRCKCATLRDFPAAPETVEDAGTFVGNATKKVVELARWLAKSPGNLPGNSGDDRYVLADDSGLEVDALDGAPGVHSARFAALATGRPGNSETLANNTKLLRLLERTPDEQRGARFRCVIALTPVLAALPHNHSPVCAADEFEILTEIFQGVCEGSIAREPRGRGGFGYDPLFIPSGYHQTFAELGEAVKNGLSHRARALEKLKGRLFP